MLASEIIGAKNINDLHLKIKRPRLAIYIANNK